MKRFVRVLALAALGCLGGNRTEAATITFDNTAPTALPRVTNAGSAAFTEDGFYVEAFFDGGVAFTAGHFHSGSGSGGTAEYQHFNGSNQLQGFLVKRTDGQAFSLNSLDFRVTNTTSIEGYSSNDVKVLVSTSFNPSQTVASQFTGFSVPVSGSFSTLSIGGFGNVTQVFISSSADVAFDNIQLGAPASGSAVPEPTSMALLGVGALGMLGYRLRRKKADAPVA